MTPAPPSAVLPLTLLYAALIVYASLFPFSGWHDQGIAPWAYLQAPWPQYWTRFDLLTNFAGYAPFGFLLTLTLARLLRIGMAMLLAVLLALLLSFSMECLQSYLPLRVASNVDFAFNVSGALAGALVAGLALRYGHVERWQRWRVRWFAPHSRGALVLLALWPVGLLSPTMVAYGMGRVLERVEDGVAALLEGTAFFDLMPLREFELEPLLHSTETLAVALGALVPCLLGFVVIRQRRRRLVFAALALAGGVAVLSLSAALAWGPAHAWAWTTPPVLWGVAAAACAAPVLAWLALPARMDMALLIAALVVQLVIVNGAAESVYFATARQSWEQGRFIHFFGLTEWIGGLWPFVALGYMLLRLFAPPTRAAPSAPLKSTHE
ncbi:MAG: VanZ family protein [Ottowia sp.]